ncbi:MAG: hypothetical protein H8D96_18245 [Desulfobacterales bacterium]|uniref:Recombinase domain-containing protein n=1 Tax=Candidatus Desulfatibia vada TaxID=2841696 RepID=A0A8J6P740_9BACT|nr:hypothetical protein [Candidatus Desulfatibia vada]
MNDFLHNLRSGKFKRNDRSNRPYKDSQQRGSQWRGDANGKKSPHQSSNDVVLEVNKALKDIAASHRRFADAYESKVRADERRAAAMESIAKVLMQRFGSDLESMEEDQEEDRSASESESEANSPAIHAEQTVKTTDFDREKLLTNISDLRKEGMSFEKIAQHLDSRGVPTLSGKGTWRGPAISRLCKEL